MKTQSFPRASRQIRVVRVSRPSVIRAIERENSRIPSAVDSWLSSVPSGRAPIIKQAPTKTYPPTIHESTFSSTQKCRRILIIICAVILTVLLIGSIVGVILAVKLQSTDSNDKTTTIIPN